MGGEGQLLKDLKKGKKSALESLYNTYAPAFLNVSLRYCGNRADAEDILHDGFIKIIRKIDTFKARSNGSFEGWMRRIIVNTALNHLRDHAKERIFTDVDALRERLADQEEDSSPFDGLQEEIGQDKIMQIICELPYGYRTVFNLFVFEEHSHKEIAGLLGCSENTSKSQLSKSRALLRKKIMQVLQHQNVE